MACGEQVLVPDHAFFDEGDNVLVQITIQHLKAKSKNTAKNADIKINFTPRGFLLTVDVQLPTKLTRKYRLAYTDKLPGIDTERCSHKVKDGIIKMFLRKKDGSQEWLRFIQETQTKVLADSNEDK